MKYKSLGICPYMQLVVNYLSSPVTVPKVPLGNLKASEKLVVGK